MVSNHATSPTFSAVEIWNRDMVEEQGLRYVARLMNEDEVYMGVMGALYDALHAELGRRDWREYNNLYFDISLRRNLSNFGQGDREITYGLSVIAYSSEGERLLPTDGHRWTERENPARKIEGTLAEIIEKVLEEVDLEKRALEFMRNHPIFFDLDINEREELAGVPIAKFNLHRVEVWDRNDDGDATVSNSLKDVAKLMVQDQGYAEIIDRLVPALQELERQFQQMNNIIPQYSFGLELEREENDSGRVEYRLTVRTFYKNDPLHINPVSGGTYTWPVNYDKGSLDLDRSLLIIVALALQEAGGANYEEVIAEILMNNHPIFEGVVE